MTKETIALIHCELDRVGIIQFIAASELTERLAALRLGLSIRQI